MRGMATEIEKLKAIDKARIEAGVCRHCAGRVPCWSLDYGDVRVGVRHPKKSHRKLERMRQEQEAVMSAHIFRGPLS